MNPWDIPAPTADDPAPRFAKLIPANDLHAIFEPRRGTTSLHRQRALELARQRFTYREHVARWQRIVGVSCIILSVLSAGYMLGQLVRAVVS